MGPWGRITAADWSRPAPRSLKTPPSRATEKREWGVPPHGGWASCGAKRPMGVSATLRTIFFWDQRGHDCKGGSVLCLLLPYRKPLPNPSYHHHRHLLDLLTILIRSADGSSGMTGYHVLCGVRTRMQSEPIQLDYLYEWNEHGEMLTIRRCVQLRGRIFQSPDDKTVPPEELEQTDK